MSKKLKYTILIIGILIFAIGLILLLGSTNLGMVEAQNAINSNGGSMDTEKYYWIMQSSATNFRITGTILSLFGGVLTILTTLKSIKQ